MAITTTSVAELVSQMQQNLDAINYHLARISDTRAHDDEIERLENERQKRADLLNLQWEQEAKALEEKRREAALPAAEKRRQEREKANAKRVQEERDLAAARKREDEEILTRRMAEDQQRQAKIAQEEEELRQVALKEEKEIKLLFAAEEERKRMEAIEKENNLYAHFEVQMEKLEEEMEKKVEESQRELADLEQKRQAISAMIDAQMRAPRPASFRRGSKRFSSSPLAADAAAMLAGKPSMPRKSTLSRIDEPSMQNKSVGAETSREIAIQSRAATLEVLTKSDFNVPKHELLPTWADQSRLDLVKGAWGMLAFREGGADMVVVESPKEKDLPHTSLIRSVFIPRVVSHRVLPTWVDQATLPVVNGHRGMLAFRDDGADLRTVLNPEHNHSEMRLQEAPTGHPHNLTMFKALASHLPNHSKTWVPSSGKQPLDDSAPLSHASQNPAFDSRSNFEAGSTDKLAVQDSNSSQTGPMNEPIRPITILPEAPWFGTSKPTQKGHPHNLTRAIPPASLTSHMPGLVKAPLPVRLPKGLCSATMNHGIDKSVSFVEPPVATIGTETVKIVGEEYDLHHPVLEELVHVTQKRNANTRQYWDADQGQLRLVKGVHGMLAFDHNGASLRAVATGNPYWTNQAKLEVVRGSHGMLDFSGNEAMMKVIRSNLYWVNQASLATVRGDHGILEFTGNGAFLKVIRPDPYWADQSKLAIVRGHHGMLKFIDDECSLGVFRADPYWVDQATLSEITGRHGKLEFNYDRTALMAVRPNIYWVDQAKLSFVQGDHGKLSFNNDHASLEVFTRNPYWADQSTLRVVRGSHARLAFEAVGASLEVIYATSNAYWVDQSTLTEVRGSHARISFSTKSASLEVVKDNSYWSRDQATLAILRGAHGRLSFTAAGASLVVVRPDPYWVNQNTLTTVRSFHGKLAFSSNGAPLRAVRPDPYWIANQSKLAAIRGTNGRLRFGSDGASVEIHRPDPYWTADQNELPAVRGTNWRFVFNSNGTALEIYRPDPYWTADQQTLGLIRGTNGRLGFGSDGAAVEIIRSNPYWGQNQSKVAVVRGIHGRLSFQSSAASLLVVRPDPYWTSNQSTLVLVRGTHGRLAFDANGASLEIVRPNPYWTEIQGALTILTGSHASLAFDINGAFMQVVRPNAYWGADQRQLHSLTGMHGTLSFNASRAALEICMQSRPYWIADQAKLDTLKGAYGTLFFDPDGAATEAAKLPTPESIDEVAQASLIRAIPHLKDEETNIYPPSVPAQESSQIARPPPPHQPVYWTEQSDLHTLQGTHGTLVFQTQDNDTIHHEILQNSFATPLESADFFADSDASDYEDFPCSSPRSKPPTPTRKSLETTPTSATVQRRSFGPGAFASLLNRFKENVPLVTNLVGNGSYSSLEQEGELGNDEGDVSPMTPDDESPSPIHASPVSSPSHHRNNNNRQPIPEPLIHQSSWHETETDDFGAFESHRHQEDQELNKAASPLPTQTAFDPFNYQSPVPTSNIWTVGTGTVAPARGLMGSWENTRSVGREVRPSGIPSPIRSMAGNRRESLISRTRAVFENPGGT